MCGPPSDSANKGHLDPRKGVGPSRQRRRERRAAERAAASMTENGTSEKVVVKSFDSVAELNEDTIDDVTTGSTEEVDVAATEKVKKVTSEKDPAVIATEECNSEAAPSGLRSRVQASEKFVAQEERESEKTVTVQCSSLGFECDQCSYTNES